MNIIVVGCGRIGAELAYRLYQQGHQVAVIEQTAAAFANLPPDFHGRTLEGEVLSQDVLRRAGIEQANALATVTNFDSLNAVVAHVARTVYHVPNVVVRNYDPHQLMLLEAFGLQVVSPSSWGAQRIEELLSHPDMHTVFSAGNGEVDIYELVIPASWNGRPLRDLLQASECRAAALTRAGWAMLPADDAILQECDVLHVSATAKGFKVMRNRLVQSKKEA